MQLDDNSWKRRIQERPAAILKPTLPTKHFVYRHSLRLLFGLNPAMIRALGKSDVDACADSLPGDGLYSIARVEEWTDANSDWIVAELASALQPPEPLRVPETIQWAHTVPIETLEMTWGTWQVAQKLPWEWTSDARKIAFIRHNLTNYPLLLKELARKPGCHEGYLVIRVRVDEIARKLLRD